MERLGRNHGRYHGESIDIDQVQREIDRLARARGWSAETFLEIPDVTLRAYQRGAGFNRNVYVAAGIHGDEPAGPLAILDLLTGDEWPEANLWLVPCLNPTGFRLNTRENADGIDLNRDYRHLKTREVSAHAAWLRRQPRFDLTLLLHEDWESNGFYVYELNPENQPSLAEAMIEAVRSICPIETAELVDNFPCRAGIIRPVFRPADRPQWAEAVFLIANQSRQNYTLETPSDFPLPARVQAHLRAVRAAFQSFGKLSVRQPCATG